MLDRVVSANPNPRWMDFGLYLAIKGENCLAFKVSYAPAEGIALVPVSTLA